MRRYQGILYGREALFVWSLAYHLAQGDCSTSGHKGNGY